MDLPVDSSQPLQRLKHVGPVRCGHSGHATVRLEAVHLCEQLIEHPLSFVVSSRTSAQQAADSTASIDPISKGTAGRSLPRLLEEDANSHRPAPIDTSTELSPLMEKNGTPASAAVSLASNVFPVPVGRRASSAVWRPLCAVQEHEGSR